jgi:2-oxoglutarate dehydrogenase E2 component (dihydrolipoamide succinyltransferase)
LNRVAGELVRLLQKQMNTNSENAVLVRWYRNDGDIVRRDEPICELETSKANVDVPAPHAGILRQLAKAGDLVQPGMNVARIDPTS